MQESERLQRISLLDGTGLDWAEVLEVWRAFESTGQGRAEMIREGLRQRLSPNAEISAIAEVVFQVLTAGLGGDLGVHRNLAIGFPSIGGILVPNVTVVRNARTRPEEEPVPGDSVILAVDIIDRPRFPYEDGTENKPREWTCAYAGIPLYLLIDPFDEEGPRVFLSSEPARGVYQEKQAVSFGRRWRCRRR
jgi:hypothetical protein